MSSTGIKSDNYDNLEADIIDVNDALLIKKINILDFINDLSEYLVDLSDNLFDVSENVVDKINDISGNLYDIWENLIDISGNLYNQIGDIINNIIDLSENIINNIFDLSGNINNNVNDVSGNLTDLINTVTDLSENVAGIKTSNNLQDVKLFGQGLQISANTDAIVALGGVVTTNVGNTAQNSSIIAGLVLSLGIPSTPLTTGTGLYGEIDTKTSRSLFGSGNVAIYGTGALEYINLVYNNDHFEDVKLISNQALNLKEPYKSLPTSLNNLSDVVNTKQNIFTCVSPLIKNDVSNNITIDLSGYVLKTDFDSSLNDIISTKQNIFTCISPLIKNDVSNNITIDLSAYPLKINIDASLNNLQNTKQDKLYFTTPLSKDVSNNITIDLSGYPIGNIKGTKATLNEGYSDSTGNSLIFYHNNPGTYFTDNSFNSFFNISSATVTNNSNLAIVPFITNYNRMFKNGINNAIKIASTGVSNSNVNSSTYILLDSGGDPTPGANIGTIKFNIATQSEGALDRFVIKPTTSVFYTNVGIGKTPYFALDVSGHLNVSLNVYTTSILPAFTGSAQNMNIRTRTTGSLNLSSETGNIYSITNSINRFRVDPSGNIYSYGNLDVSGNMNSTVISENNISLINKYATIENLNLKQDILTFSNPLIKDISNNISIDLSAYALKNALNASNVTAGTLPVSFGGTGATTLNNNQILIGNGTNALLQSPNLIWDSSRNGLGIGITQLFDTPTNFQVNNRRLWINSTPNSSISVLSTDKYGTGTTENYIQLIENAGIDFRGNSTGAFNFRFATKQVMTVDISGVQMKNLNVTGELTVNENLYGRNNTSKSLIKFQTKLGQNSLYYYNIDLDKYYKTGQTINGNEYKIFNLTSWAEDGFSIINKCTVYISSQSPGIKYIMFYDNWGAYLSNGNQSGWQRDNSTRYMTFVSATQKNIITILENLL